MAMKEGVELFSLPAHPSAPQLGVLRQPKKQLEHRAGAVLPLTSCEWPIRHLGKVL